MSNSKPVPVDVTFVNGGATEIVYHHNIFGLMKLEVEDGVATLDSEWDRLKDGSLKDGFDRSLTTGDVLRSVLRLPFIDDVEVVR